MHDDRLEEAALLLVEAVYFADEPQNVVHILWEPTATHEHNTTWLFDYCNSRMRVSGHGLIFQPVLVSLFYKQTYTYNNDTIMTLQKFDTTDWISK